MLYILTGLQSVTTDYKPYFPNLGYTNSWVILYISKYKILFLEAIDGYCWRAYSKFWNYRPWRWIHVTNLTGTKKEIKDILSILVEFNLSKNSNNRRRTMLWKLQPFPTQGGRLWQLHLVGMLTVNDIHCLLPQVKPLYQDYTNKIPSPLWFLIDSLSVRIKSSW